MLFDPVDKLANTQDLATKYVFQPCEGNKVNSIPFIPCLFDDTGSHGFAL